MYRLEKIRIRRHTRQGERRQGKYGIGGVIWRGAACLLLFGLTVAEAPTSRAGAPVAPDANALVRKMVATYQRASTIQETSEARIEKIGEGQYVQTNTLKYKKPNKLMLQSQDPVAGTITAYAKGDTVTLYSGKQNIFTLRTAPPTFAKTVALISKASGDLMGTSLTQVLNPISFLLAKGMPVEAQSFRYANMQTIEGHKTYVILAKASESWMRKQVPSREFVPDKRDIVLNIDTKTNLLVRAMAILTWRRAVRAAGSKQARYQMIGARFTEIHRGTVLNGTIADSVFDFNASRPKGATEVYQEHR